jgi:aminoglycoside phosphotransferase family enzyme/predicted kinase
VRLPFLDFSTFEARRHYCEEELRLNRRSAPEIYLEVVPIGGDPRRPRVGAGDPVLEHAVKMRRFPQEALLAAMARAGRLEAVHVDALADAVAQLHAGAARSPPRRGRDHGARRDNAALANFVEIRGTGAGDPALDLRLEALHDWTRFEGGVLAGRFAERAAGGFERECHGDLHLANVALVDGRPLPFDGIEFSAALRWIDVASDVAFAAMDLHRHGLPRLAARFVNRYLERTGDYGALAVLRYYMVYRAMVRAKVAAIGLAQAPRDSPRARERRAELVEHVELAEWLCRRGPALLVAMHGLPGSGKTTVAGRLLEALGAVRVRSDVERKRLCGLEAGTRAGTAPSAGIYSPALTRATYDRLAEVAHTALAAGFPVIVDATFERRGQRDRFRELARMGGAAFRLVGCAAPEAVLRARILARAGPASDASDADLAVLEHRLRSGEPPAGDEAGDTLEVDTASPDLDSNVELLAQRLAGAAPA